MHFASHSLTIAQGYMTLTDGLWGSVIKSMNMYAIHLDFWIFGGRWSRNEIWTKNSLSGHGDFFPNLDKKSQVLRFGRDFEGIWKGFGGDLEHPSSWIFEHLDR